MVLEKARKEKENLEKAERGEEVIEEPAPTEPEKTAEEIIREKYEYLNSNFPAKKLTLIFF